MAKSFNIPVLVDEKSGETIYCTSIAEAKRVDPSLSMMYNEIAVELNRAGIVKALCKAHQFGVTTGVETTPTTTEIEIALQQRDKDNQCGKGEASQNVK